MGYFQARREYAGDNLRSTAFDRVASLLVAVLTIVGTLVLVLLGLWVAPQQQDEVVIVYQPTLVDILDEEDEPFQFETPAAHELPGVPLIQTPALFAANMAEAMATVTTIDVNGSDAASSEPHDELNDLEQVPRWERWEIRYASSSVDAYARQLDHFRIELGAAGGGRKNVDYASGFTTSSPQVRSGPGSEETRLYMTWRDGPLKNFDRTLLQRSGVAVEGRILLQFYPQRIEGMLAALEAEQAEDGPVEQILKTAFGIRAAADGYEFFVQEQTYR